MREIIFSEISERMDSLDLPDVEHVVGIASGGIVPAALVAFKKRIPCSFIHIHYRDENNVPCHEEPQLMQAFLLTNKVQKIILADDVSVSGKTIEKAREVLKNFDVKTFVLSGKGDFVLFPEIISCVLWPWKKRQADQEEVADG